MWWCLTPLLLIIGLGGGIWLVVNRKEIRLIKSDRIGPYLFFIRFPLALAIGVCAFPVVSNRVAPNMVGSLFVLTPGPIAFVTFVACLCVWAITYFALVLWYSGPFRESLNFSDSQPDTSKTPEIPNPDGEVLREWWAYLVLLLLWPLACVLWQRADTSKPYAAVAIAIGVAAAILFRQLMSMVVHLTTHGSLKPFTETRTAEVKYRQMRGRAERYGAICVAVYFVIGYGGLFGSKDFKASIPALLYVYAFTLLITVVLTGLSYAVDKFRIPVVSLLAILVFTLKWATPSEFEYHVSRWNGDSAIRVDLALNKFAKSGNGDVVVVAASGGGIAASLWTTVVLRALDTLGRGATDSLGLRRHIALVSSVSGGSVGAMYYVNAFGPSGRHERNLDSVVAASKKSSLSAATWGLMYPDVWRLVHASWLFGHRDRAQAQETRWEESLGDESVTLATWAPGIGDAWRPIQIFNATIEETGERLLLAPVRLLPDTSGQGPAQWREFLKLYRGKDIKVVTAARLSATFPYVTPHARPDVENSLNDVAFHVADGGYYDNSGIVTALETIWTWLRSDQYDHSARRIALIEIRAGGPIDTVSGQKAQANAMRSIVGPLNTTFNVRSTAQVARNLEEVRLFKVWAHDSTGSAFEHFVFHLSEPSPLSWHLTREEAGRIERHLGAPLLPSDTSRQMIEAWKQNVAELAKLAAFFTGTPTSGGANPH